MLPDFGYGGVTPDHRHDAFVEIVECFPWASCNDRQDILSAPLARLFGHRCQLGQRFTVFPGNVRKISQGIDTRETRHGEIGLHINATPMTCPDSQIV